MGALVRSSGRVKPARSSEVYVLGIDPGFANIGCAVLRLTPTSEVPVLMEVIRTSKSAAKRNVRASEDNLDRAKEITAELLRLIAAYDIRLICAETMSFPRSSSSAAKMAMCWGVLAAVAHAHSIPVVQASPQEIKKVLCRKKDASKEEVQAALRERYPCMLEAGNADVKTSILKDVPRSLWEHPYDAAAAVVACRESEIFLLARRMVPCEDLIG